MKNFLKFAAAGIVLASAAAVWAADDKEMKEFRQWKQRKEQRQQAREEKRKEMQAKRMDRLAKELNLTDEQKSRISAIMEDSWKKAEGERKAYRDKVQQIRKDSDAKIVSQLNKEQAAKWEKIKKNRRGKAMRKMHERHGRKGRGRMMHGDKMRGAGMTGDDDGPGDCPPGEWSDN